jgi:hypothetical protein
MTMLQRQYANDAAGAPRCTHVRVIHTGTHPQQNFSHRVVEQALVDGWMHLESDGKIATLTVTAEPEDLHYRLKRAPGYYCRSTGELIPISPTAWTRMRSTGQGDMSSREAKAWLLARGKDAGDYEVTNAYECVLDAEQHAKFQAVRDGASNVVAAYTQE